MVVLDGPLWAQEPGRPPANMSVQQVLCDTNRFLWRGWERKAVVHGFYCFSKPLISKWSNQACF
jgi:hypothetical protein